MRNQDINQKLITHFFNISTNGIYLNFENLLQIYNSLYLFLKFKFYPTNKLLSNKNNKFVIIDLTDIINIPDKPEMYYILMLFIVLFSKITNINKIRYLNAIKQYYNFVSCAMSCKNCRIRTKITTTFNKMITLFNTKIIKKNNNFNIFIKIELSTITDFKNENYIEFEKYINKYQINNQIIYFPLINSKGTKIRNTKFNKYFKTHLINKITNISQIS